MTPRTKDFSCTGGAISRRSRRLTPQCGKRSDVAMPKIDGFKALGMLKNDRRTKDIPVIVITAKGHPDDLDTARSLGAHDYINKPWSHGEVELRVQWAITAVEKAMAAREKRELAS